MRKIILFVITLALSVTLAACAPESNQPPTLTPAETGNEAAGQSETPTGPGEPQTTQDRLLAFSGTVIEAADYELEKLLALVRPFNVCPEEFDDPAELSDAALFFAAVTELNGSFELQSDGMTYSLPMKELAPAVKKIFGPSAALSESWLGGAYEPYAVDAASETVIKYSLGQITELNFTYACVKIDGGWELWLLDLYDPLFSDANPVVVSQGDASGVKWDMVAPYAAKMQTGVYTIKTGADGEYYLAAFHYRNFKDVAHFAY